MLRSAGTHKLSCVFPRLRLYPGLYHLSFRMGASEPRRIFETPRQICPFEVAVLDEIRGFYWVSRPRPLCRGCPMEFHLLEDDQGPSTNMKETHGCGLRSNGGDVLFQKRFLEVLPR